MVWLTKINVVLSHDEEQNAALCYNTVCPLSVLYANNLK